MRILVNILKTIANTLYVEREGESKPFTLTPSSVSEPLTIYTNDKGLAIHLAIINGGRVYNRNDGYIVVC